MTDSLFNLLAAKVAVFQVTFTFRPIHQPDAI